MCALNNNNPALMTTKLTRLKLEGGLSSLLNVHLTWQQFGTCAVPVPCHEGRD